MNWTDKKVKTKNIRLVWTNLLQYTCHALKKRFELSRVYGKGLKANKHLSGRFYLSKLRVTEGKTDYTKSIKEIQGNRFWFELAEGLKSRRRLPPSSQPGEEHSLI